MTENIHFDPRLVAWIVSYEEPIGGEVYVFAPPEFTFDDKPSDELLAICQREARSAFVRTRNYILL